MSEGLLEARNFPHGLVESSRDEEGSDAGDVSDESEYAKGPVGALHALKKILLVYEDRDDWAEQAVKEGFSPEAAEEASYWLLSKERVDETKTLLLDGAKQSGIDVDVIKIDHVAKKFDAYFGGDRNKKMLLWNITDGSSGFRGSHIAALAELTKTRYFGCRPFAQSIGQDKYKLYMLCKQLGISVPASILIENGKEIHSLGDIDRITDYFVKPNSFGNKVGLTEGSLCPTKGDALRHATGVGQQFRTRMILQEFIGGPEIRVTFINASRDGKARFGYELVQAGFDNYSFIAKDKRETAYDQFIDATNSERFVPETREHILNKIEDAVFKLAQHMLLKDYFTFDFRIDVSGAPHLIDFNPGAFLYGENVEGYTKHAFQSSLSDALFRAMRNSHSGHPCPLVSGADCFFRI